MSKYFVAFVTTLSYYKIMKGCYNKVMKNEKQQLQFQEKIKNV